MLTCALFSRIKSLQDWSLRSRRCPTSSLSILSSSNIRLTVGTMLDCHEVCMLPVVLIGMMKRMELGAILSLVFQHLSEISMSLSRFRGSTYSKGAAQVSSVAHLFVSYRLGNGTSSKAAEISHHIISTHTVSFLHYEASPSM